MATRLRILCINKSDRYDAHERILYIGGLNADGTRWKFSQPDAVIYIETGTYDFYVSVAGDEVDVVVAVSRYGNKYIKTEADGDQPNNLLSLPECP
jgi:Protein of unknown function (DUF3892)